MSQFTTYPSTVMILNSPRVILNSPGLILNSARVALTSPLDLLHPMASLDGCYRKVPTAKLSKYFAKIFAPQIQDFEVTVILGGGVDPTHTRQKHTKHLNSIIQPIQSGPPYDCYTLPPIIMEVEKGSLQY